MSLAKSHEEGGFVLNITPPLLPAPLLALPAIFTQLHSITTQLPVFKEIGCPLQSLAGQ